MQEKESKQGIAPVKYHLTDLMHNEVHLSTPMQILQVHHGKEFC